MKISEITLDEQSVLSSWIEDLEMKDGGVRMELNNGRAYEIHGMDYEMLQAWLFASSKGGFWHAYVKGKYLTQRTA